MLAAVGMTKDPFTVNPEAFKVVRQRFVPLKNPAIVSLEQAPDVAPIVKAVDPDVAALLVVPVRSGFGLHGLAQFYFRATDPLPAPTSLGHVSLMARALGAWFVVRHTQTLEAGAQTARGALPEIERVMRLVSELLRAAAREPQKASQHLQKAARTLDTIALVTAGLSAQPFKKH
jgi:hypothetical protein